MRIFKDFEIDKVIESLKQMKSNGIETVRLEKELTEDEAEFLELYNQLSDDEKYVVRALANYKSQKQANVKK